MEIARRIVRKIKRHATSLRKDVSVAGTELSTKVEDTRFASGKRVVQRLPGFVYGYFRNVAPYRFFVNATVSRVRLSLIDEKPEVINFNYISFWVKKDDGSYAKYDGSYQCAMSSVAEVLPDPDAAMQGTEGNSVSVHSKREIKPWWEVTFAEPVELAYIELYNRKDIHGKRERSLLVTAYNAQDKKVKRFSRVSSQLAWEQFQTQAAPLLKNTLDYMADLNSFSDGPALKKAVESFIFAPQISYKQDKEALLALLEKAHLAARQPTPDLPDSLNSALEVTIPDNAKALRITGFRRKLKRAVQLKVSVNEKILCLDEQSVSPTEALIELKARIWTLQHAHIFSLPLGTTTASTVVKIFCDDFYSKDAFVQRLVEYQDADGQWHTVETTLNNLQARVGLVTLHEWIIGTSWSASFTRHLAHLLATYRMSQARTAKPLLRANRGLLPDFYEGIKEGAHSATYIPAVTYTRHGLTIPFSEIDSGFLADRMAAFAAYLKAEYSLDAFPCYGTLLGIYRDGDFLPHDDDIDLAVIVDLPDGKTYRQATEDWAQKLSENGLQCRPPTPMSLNLHCYFEDFDMDLFFIYRIPEKSDKVWTHMQGYNVREVDRKLLEPLSELKFKGFTFNTPGNIEGFLKDRYGEGWVTPDPTYEL
ncbi:LicD family protein [Salinimonas lutimaris]|uniref:LicD family protein n=1 Tax=Salinimonas lutimaris TaxID=914153 RepID=UPI0010BFFAE8|nr:LicD family protein [Salinimonas lutimaris]